ncbi:MAG: trehalose-phosphatase [Nitrospiraceae bacterium]
MTLMQDVLSPAGKTALRTFLAQPTLYAFDFDGTLSRIVRERDAARLAPSVRRWLDALAKLVPVAVISGRSLTDLSSRVGPDIPYLVGNHGLEGADTPPSVIVQAREICAVWKQQLAGIPLAELEQVGVSLEDKDYSLTLHYRLSPNKPRARQLLFETVARLTPAPRLILGKAVVNAMPAGVPHKGDAVLALLRRAKVEQALYVGDDDTDEDVFALTHERIFSIRVGVKQTSRAPWYVGAQADVTRLLTDLVQIHDPELARTLAADLGGRSSTSLSA